MKNLLYFSAMLVIVVTFFAGCQQDPDSFGSPVLMPMTASITSDAHPAWTFPDAVTVYDTVIVHKKKTITSHTNRTIAVSDDDGTDVTTIYTSPTDQSVSFTISPTWSPSGVSISFIDRPIAVSGAGTYSL